MLRFFEEYVKQNQAKQQERNPEQNQNQYYVYDVKGKQISKSDSFNNAIIEILDDLRKTDPTKSYAMYAGPRDDSKSPLWSGNKSDVINYMNNHHMMPCSTKGPKY